VPRLYVLVLSGGAGTRLWPLSRRDRPKQFLELLGERSLLQDTVDRVSEFVPKERIFVVAPPEHRALIHEQLPDLPVDHLVVEPYPRGNAAAIGLAMAALAAFDPDAVAAVLPSDHVVGDRGQFRKVLIAAVRRVRQPDCRFDSMLILESPQGTGKLRALRILAVEDAWFADKLPLDAREILETTADKWIVKASELSLLSQEDVGSLKTCLSRFLWVRVQRFDLERLRINRDQLWAEAAAAEAAGEAISF